MHGSAVDDTAKRTSRAGTKPRLDGHEHDAMQWKERHDWAIIYQASTAYTLKRQTGLVLQHESSFENFSLKCFLLKKTLLACLEKAKQRYKAIKNN